MVASYGRSQSTSALVTAAGCSSVDRWPLSGIVTSRDPGMPAAISRASSGGVASSPSPTRTSVGQGIGGETRTRIRPAEDGLLLAQIGLKAGVFGHAAHDALERFVAVTVAMHIERKSEFRDLRIAAVLGHRHQDAAPLGLLRRVRPRPGIEQRQFGDALRRLAHDLEGDVAAHRQPGRAKRGGAAARIRRAIAAMLSSRRWSATMTGPNCHSAGICSL